jgi:hypothetical protein
MSKELAESCRLHSALLLTIFCTRTFPIGTPAGEKTAISTSGGGPLGKAASGGGGAERRDHAATAATATLPLSRKARRVTLCRAASSFRSESNTSHPAIGLEGRPWVTKTAGPSAERSDLLSQRTSSGDWAIHRAFGRAKSIACQQFWVPHIPRFPVELRGFPDLHAPFLKRKAHALILLHPLAGNRGISRSEMWEKLLLAQRLRRSFSTGRRSLPVKMLGD